MKISFALSRIVLFILVFTTIKSSGQTTKAVSLNHVAVYVFDLKKAQIFIKILLTSLTYQSPSMMAYIPGLK